jgi:hypothetical protein
MSNRSRKPALGEAEGLEMIKKGGRERGSIPRIPLPIGEMVGAIYEFAPARSPSGLAVYVARLPPALFTEPPGCGTCFVAAADIG